MAAARPGDDARPTTDGGDPPEVITTTEARQGFLGKRALRILLTSLALTVLAGAALFATRGWWGV
jgi:hypothetical protein